MTRKFKSLGVASLAVFAVMAVGMSAAQAAPTDLTFGTASGTVHAGQTTEQVFTTNAGTVRCSTSTQTGSWSGNATVSTLEVTPSYSGCKAFGFLSATVDVNGCKYHFAGGENTTGLVSIKNCTNAAKDMTVTTFGCVVHVPEQGPLSHVLYTNGAGDVDVNAQLTGIKYTATEGCPNGSGTFTNGTLTGGATLTAKDTAGVATTVQVN
jgi:hypothetical protein